MAQALKLPPLRTVAMAAACLAQLLFNRWGIASAAMLPAVLAAYAFAHPGDLLPVTAATWGGAVLAIVLAGVARIRSQAELAEPEVATTHAAVLALGCLVLIIVNTAANLPHEVWAVTALCLVLLPSTGETRAQAIARILATAAGAVAATALAVALPDVVCFGLAAVFAILTVAYALMPESDAHFLHVASLTATVILLYGAGKVGKVLSLAGERILLTAIAGVLAIVLTAVMIYLSPYVSRLRAATSNRQPAGDSAPRQVR